MKLGPEIPIMESREIAQKKKEEKYLDEQMQKKLSYSKKSFVDSVSEAIRQGKKFNEAFMAVLKSAGRLKDYDQIDKPVLSNLEKKLRSKVSTVLRKRGAEKRSALKEKKEFENSTFTPEEWREITSGAKAKDLQERKIAAGKGMGTRRITPAIKAEKIIKEEEVEEKQLDLPF